MSKCNSALVATVTRNFPTSVATDIFRFILSGLLVMASPHLLGQATASIVTPTAPTYVDSVTGLVTIAGQPTATGTVTYSVDGGATSTANLVNGNAYLNLGQFTKGNHVLSAAASYSAGGLTTVPAFPPPVPFTVADKEFAFIGTQGHVLTFADGYSFSVRAVLSDDHDNLYASDFALNRVQFADRLGNVTTLPLNGLANPWGLAFDANGDLYIADYTNSRVIEYSKAGVETTLPISGLGRPTQLASDRSRNLLYIEDPDNNRVLTFDLSAGKSAGEAVSGITQLVGITVAPNGDLYFSSRTGGFFHRTLSGSVVPLYFNINQDYIGDIYADRKGNLYVTDQGYNVVLRIDSQGNSTRIDNASVPVIAMADDSYGHIYLALGPRVDVLTPGSGQFADTVSEGANPSNNSLIYSMPQGQTGLTSAVAPSVNFNLFGGYTCPSVAQWGTCNTFVNFAARVPGLRVGNATSSSSPGGPVISTAIYGRSLGSAPAFSPGTQTSSSAGTALASGVFLDQLGNYYASDLHGNQVYETPAGGTPAALPFTGLSQPTTVAVDGLGAVYALDYGNNRIVKLDAAGSQTSLRFEDQSNSNADITSFVLDGSSQVFYARTDGTIHLYDRNGVSTPYASGLGISVALALDQFRELYTLQADGSLVRIDIYGNQIILARAGTFANAMGLAVDASQTAYVVETTTGTVSLLHPDGSTQIIPVPELRYAAGISIDGHGSILALDSVTNQYTFVDRTHQDFNFGDVPVNTSKTFFSAFTNSGTAPFTITGGLPGNQDFKQVVTPDACDSSISTTIIAAASSCNLSYTVAPTAVGPIAAYSRITTDASLDFDAFTQNVVASSTLALTPTLEFGNVHVGSTLNKSLSLTNSSASAVSLTGASLTGNGFEDRPGNCGSSIAAGATCTLGVSFTPSALGGVIGTFTLTDSAGTQAATLTGNGVSAAPIVTLTPTNFDFGAIQLGATSAPHTFILINTSTIPIAISDPGSLPFSNFNSFKIISDSCTTTLAAGASCSATVTFHGGPITGSQALTLTFSDDAGTQSAALTATVVPDTVTLTPTTLDFGSVQLGATSAPHRITLTNTSTVPIAISNPGSLPFSNFNSFKITSDTCATTLAAGASCSATVTFRAGPITGDQALTMTFMDDAGTQTVALTGTVVAPSGPPAEIEFGNGFTADALTLNGPAAVTKSVLQLTSNHASQTSSAFFPTSVSTTSFTTDFTFQLLDPLAEGITFTIQGDGANAVGSAGGGLGYQGIAKSIALKFDLRDTAGEGTDSTGLYVNGAAPTVPYTSLAGSGIDLHSGHIFALHLAYDGTTEDVTLTDTVTKALWTTAVAENISSIVGGKTAYFGFTAATGATAAAAAKPTADTSGASLNKTANILSWTYVNQSLNVTPPATLAPTSLNFGDVTVGSTGPAQIAELTNTGKASFQVSSITQSDPAIIVHTSFCARAITPGSFCKLEVTFEPTATGPFSGTVVVSYFLGDGSAPSQNFTSTLQITAIGNAPNVTLSPASVDFGTVNGDGTSLTKTFTITNNAASAVSLSQITIVGPFRIAAGATCIYGAQLPAGKSCAVPVIFVPIAGGSSSGTLYVSYLGVSGRAVTRTASLIGTATGAFVAVTPTILDFGNVVVGTSSPTKNLTITNTGTVTVTLLRSSSKGTGDFPLSGGSCGISNSLAPGQSCIFRFTFSPTTVGAISSMLSFGFDQVTASATISGTGAAPSVPILLPANLDFSLVDDGASGGPLTSTFYNSNVGPIVITDIENTDPASYYFNGGTCLAKSLPLTLLPGQSCSIVVTFVPFPFDASGMIDANFTVHYQSNGNPKETTLTGTLSGRARRQPPPTISVTNIDFGNVLAGAGATQTVTVTNVGTIEIEVGIMDSNPFVFAITTDCQLASSLQPGQHCTASISFYPMFTIGANSAALTINYFSAVVPSGIVVSGILTGNALPEPPPSLSSTNLNFGTLTDDSNGSSRALTVTNVGEVQIEVSITDTDEVSFPFSGCEGGTGVLQPTQSCTITFEYHSIRDVGPTTNSATFELGYGSSVLPNGANLSGTLTGTYAPNGALSAIDFSNGFIADALTLNGPANATNGVLQLTSGPSVAASSAFFPTLVAATGFTTDVTFQLLDPSAEGITYTIQGDSPNAVGKGGGGLGYQGIAKSIALKFDLKDTAGEGVDSTGVYINGAAPTIPAIPLASFGIDLHSGHVFALHLDYDGTLMSTSLSDTETKAIWKAQEKVDVPGIVGGNAAYVGFTAGSGIPALTTDAAASEHRVRSAPSASAASQAATATSKILLWTYTAASSKGTVQTITFPALAAQTYGAAPIHLSATATSGLPMSYVVTGPAKLYGTTLTLTGAGTVTLTAIQTGNAVFAAAQPVTQSFIVAKAPLTVKADNLSRVAGAANPKLTYTITGLVDGDPSAVIGGSATLATSAISISPAGSYPITFANEGLNAANYSFTYVAGTLIVAAAGSRCTVVDYSRGFASAGLILNGSSKILNGLLQLTDGKQFESASAYFSSPLPTSSFTTDITFQLLDPDADGITFLVQAVGPHALGEAGGGLGYAGIQKSVALKFDLHNNAGEGTNSTGVYLNGAFPGQPSLSLDESNIDLHSGHVFQAHLSYDGQGAAFTLTDTATGLVLHKFFPGNIMDGISTSSAYFGFTAGTGARTATQNILAWTYSGGNGCAANR